MSVDRAPKVAFIGNLAGEGYRAAKVAEGAGAAVELFLNCNESLQLVADGISDSASAVPIVRIGIDATRARTSAGRILHRIRAEIVSLAAVRRLLAADLIQSYTGSLFFLSALSVLLFGVLRLKPYIACATGSDLREAAATERGLRGFLFRLFFRRAAVTLILNLDLMSVADRLRLRNARFSAFPIDTQRFAPRAVARRYCGADELLVFMPSRLDWGVTDNTPGRSSTKGNDRLIRGFAAFLALGHRGHLVLLDRGADREVAHRLVVELGIAEHAAFLPEMSLDSLIEHFNMADVVADQFDIGAFGLTGPEAMSCAKPVLIYIDSRQAARCYAIPPPILNARNEAEICNALTRMTDPAERADIGRRARDWILQYHDSSVVGRQYAELYREILSSAR
jgi:glycosyltransferase involved in cell wall biosynthesis